MHLFSLNGLGVKNTVGSSYICLPVQLQYFVNVNIFLDYNCKDFTHITCAHVISNTVKHEYYEHA